MTASVCFVVSIYFILFRRVYLLIVYIFLADILQFLLVSILFLFLIDELNKTCIDCICLELFSTIQHNTNNFKSERLKIAFFSEFFFYYGEQIEIN